jgi:hypothetical protein
LEHERRLYSLYLDAWGQDWVIGPLVSLAAVLQQTLTEGEHALSERQLEQLGLIAADQRPRLLVLTDIGGNPDDTQSMVRLMLYSNEFQIEGLIASASGTPGELKQKITQPQLIREVVAAYGQVRDNLAKHAAGYPTADDLNQRIKSGNPNRGMSAVGEGHDTDGSRWIIRVVDTPDERPLNIAIWGGQTDLAQALWRVRQDRGDAGVKHPDNESTSMPAAPLTRTETR